MQRAFGDVSAVLHKVAPGLRSSMRFHDDAGGSGGVWSLGQYVLTVLGTGAALEVVRALGGFLSARAGRRVRLKIGDVEAEASSVDEVKRLLDIAEKRLPKALDTKTWTTSPSPTA